MASEGIGRKEPLSAVQSVFAQKLQSGSPPHAVIVEGPRGSGKRRFALWCAQALLCTSGGDKPCGVCDGCRRVLEGYHPDLHFFGEESTVTVADVRELIRQTGLVPIEGDRSVYLLSRAEKMLSSAQNALLKVFEEPPPGVTIFLLTESRRALLPTVRSRGLTVTMPGLTDEQLYAQLRLTHPRASETELASAVRVAQGSLGEAVAFLEKDAQEACERARDWLDACLSGDVYRLIGSIATGKANRDGLLPVFDVFLRLLSDLLLSRVGGMPVLLREGEAHSLSRRVTKNALARMCGQALVCRERLESNGNVTAALSCFASELCAIAGRTVSRDVL